MFLTDITDILEVIELYNLSIVVAEGLTSLGAVPLYK